MHGVQGRAAGGDVDGSAEVEVDLNVFLGAMTG